VIRQDQLRVERKGDEAVRRRRRCDFGGGENEKAKANGGFHFVFASTVEI